MMLSRVLVRLLAWGVVLAAPVRSAAAQPTIIDAGQFIISRNGQRVGTESFTVARVITGNTTQLRATATHREGDKETIDTLVTDSLGSPTYYSYLRTQAGQQVVRLGASRSGNRLTVTSRTVAGDASTRELLVSDGMVLLNQEVFSQFYFLFLPQSSGQAPTLVAPFTWARTSGVVRGGGPGDVADSKVPTTHFTFGETEIWVSRDHQIVKIEIPSQHLVVVREQPPR